MACLCHVSPLFVKLMLPKYNIFTLPLCMWTLEELQSNLIIIHCMTSINRLCVSTCLWLIFQPFMLLNVSIFHWVCAPYISNAPIFNHMVCKLWYICIYEGLEIIWKSIIMMCECRECTLSRSSQELALIQVSRYLVGGLQHCTAILMHTSQYACAMHLVIRD